MEDVMAKLTVKIFYHVLRVKFQPDKMVMVIQIPHWLCAGLAKIWEEILISGIDSTGEWRLTSTANNNFHPKMAKKRFLLGEFPVTDPDKLSGRPERVNLTFSCDTLKNDLAHQVRTRLHSTVLKLPVFLTIPLIN